ncbi:hypothetical protein ACLOJK_027661, partial [Asimina triloba]
MLGRRCCHLKSAQFCCLLQSDVEKRGCLGFERRWLGSLLPSSSTPELGRIQDEHTIAVRLDGSDRPIGPSPELGRTAATWRRWSTEFWCSGGAPTI